MSDQEDGKKMVEEAHLELFVEAYEYSTGVGLLQLARGERPDFLCERPDGQRVGVELAQIMKDPEQASDERIFGPRTSDPAWQAMEEVHRIIEKKDRLRKDYFHRLVDNTILALQLMDWDLGALLPFLSSDVQGDFTGHGFVEIWLCDHTEVEAYSDVELFCLFPPAMWGHYERLDRGKPYG